MRQIALRELFAAGMLLLGMSCDRSDVSPPGRREHVVSRSSAAPATPETASVAPQGAPAAPEATAVPPPAAPESPAQAPEPPALAATPAEVAQPVVHRGAPARSGVVLAAAPIVLPEREIVAPPNQTDAAAPASPPPAPVVPPAMPVQVQAWSESETAVKLRWTHSDEARVARYEVLRGGNVVATVAAAAAEVGGFSAQTDTCFAVRACDAAGTCSAPSAEACARTLDLTPPTAPGSANAKADSDRRVTVSWAPSHDNVEVTMYEVTRNDGVQIRQRGDTTSVADETVSPVKRFCYTVVALDASKNASQRSPEACVVPPDLVPPSVPAHLLSGSRQWRHLALAWDPATDDVGVVGYEVLEKDAVVAKVEGTLVEFGKIAPDVDHCLAVRALDAAGNRSAPSEPLCARTASRSQPTGPWNLRGLRDPLGQLLLSWDPSPQRGMAYQIFRDDGQGERLIGTTTSPRYIVRDREGQDAHCYKIAAIDTDSHESPRTLPLCVRARLATAKAGEAPGAAEKK